MRLVRMLIATLVVGALAACSGGAASLTPPAAHAPQAPVAPSGGGQIVP